MTEYVTLSDGKTHRVTDSTGSDLFGHYVQTACGCHIRERQENVDVYLTEESPDVKELCRNCDRAGDNELPTVLKES